MLEPCHDPKQSANSAVKSATKAAGVVGGVAGALPVPMVDVAVVAPIQIHMIRSIAEAYGLPECERTAVEPISLLLGAGTATLSRAAAEKATQTALRQFAKVLAERAVRFVPLVGAAVGATISATVAVRATKALGEAWIKVCEYALSNELKKLDAFLESDMGKLLIEVLTRLGHKVLLDTLITDAKLRQTIADPGGD
jgi:uncharacterized protein (DUF697 family)